VYWKPVWHVLEETLELVLANAQHVKNVPGHKSDGNDAMWLADLLAHGLVRGSFVPPAHIQEVRDLSRTRKQLTPEIIQHTNRIPAAPGTVSSKKAIIAVVASMLTAVYHILREQQGLRREVSQKAARGPWCRGRSSSHHRWSFT